MMPCNSGFTACPASPRRNMIALLSAVPVVDPAEKRPRIIWPPEGTTPEQARASLHEKKFERREVRPNHWVLEEVA